MEIIKSLFAIVLFLAIAVGGVFAAAQRGLIPTERIAQLKNAINIINRPELQTVTQTTRDGISILTSKTEESASKAGVVLGSHIQASDSQPPLTQRAFEYARYSYCQEVVKDYTSRYSTTTPPTN